MILSFEEIRQQRYRTIDLLDSTNTEKMSCKKKNTYAKNSDLFSKYTSQSEKIKYNSSLIKHICFLSVMKVRVLRISYKAVGGRFVENENVCTVKNIHLYMPQAKHNILYPKTSVQKSLWCDFININLIWVIAVQCYFISLMWKKL